MQTASLAPETQRGAQAIHRRIAAAQNCDAFAFEVDLASRRLAEILLNQKWQRVKNTIQSGARNLDVLRLLRDNCKINGVKLLAQDRQRNIATDPDALPERNSTAL